MAGLLFSILIKPSQYESATSTARRTANKDGLSRFCAGRGLIPKIATKDRFQQAKLSCGVKTLKSLQLIGELDKKVSETALMSSKNPATPIAGFFMSEANSLRAPP